MLPMILMTTLTVLRSVQATVMTMILPYIRATLRDRLAIPPAVTAKTMTAMVELMR
jgi:hypothetical protein